jgi:hypothetical protein
LEIITTVTVNFSNALYPEACVNQYGLGGGFTVSFDSVVNKAGNLPEMIGSTNNLVGLRYVVVNTSTTGSAAIGGTYRLSFRGAVTDAIDPTSLTSLQTALVNLDTIPSTGVTVAAGTGLTSSYEYIYTITYSSTLYGNVEALQVVEYYNLLTGSDVAATVFTDAEESLSERGGFTTASVAGNEVSGTFVLDYRGYTTEAIDSDASNTQMQTRLQALPNIGSVNVVRTGPTPQMQYQWTVTFMSMPGSFPDGTGSIAQLTSPSANSATLLGTSSVVDIATYSQASTSLGGTFTLTVMNGTTSTETTADIEADASSVEVAYALNQLLTVGHVSVSRVTVANGYSWLVTFDGCKVVNGTDVCSEGNIALLNATADSTLSLCSSSEVMSVTQVVEGSGPGESCASTGNSSSCVGYVDPVISDSPYKFLLSSLTTGSPYYVRIASHNTLGYGYPALSQPEFQTPTYRPPGAPPPVRLVSSTTTTIAVEWSSPRYNGGATVMGYELYIEDWAGGEPRLVFDGTDQPTVTTFTVGTTPLIENTLGISPGKSYRFMVRAINYCISGSSTVACLGTLSEPSVFAARGPRVPLPPTIPYRSSSSLIGSTSTSSSITIRWDAPIDNGGSAITG